MAAERALVPVGVDLIGEDDDVTLAEVQLALMVRMEGVHRPATGLIQDQLTVSWARDTKTDRRERERERQREREDQYEEMFDEGCPRAYLSNQPVSLRP